MRLIEGGLCIEDDYVNVAFACRRRFFCVGTWVEHLVTCGIGAPPPSAYVSTGYDGGVGWA
ncbi:hypothetical protein Hanom_Chr10g00932071 [Helianthus anomalus]